MDHVAIIQPGLVDELLCGRKSVETRLSARRVSPYGRVSPGDIVYFRGRGGGYAVRAVVDHVEYFSELTPKRIAALRDVYEEHVRGGSAYWKSKRGAKFGTFMHLSNVTACRAGPDLSSAKGYSPRAGWHAMGGRASRAA